MTSRIDPLAEQMRQIREAKGLSKAGLSRLAGYSPGVVRLYEIGAKSPRIQAVNDCLQAMGFKLKIVRVEE